MGLKDRIQNCSVCQRIPPHMIDAIDRYVEHRIPPGSFTTALLSNDLIGAAQRADSTNQNLLWEYCFLLHNYLPTVCYGSSEAVSAWLRGDADG